LAKMIPTAGSLAIAVCTGRAAFAPSLPRFLAS
jgi:hypothetical protein